MLANAGCGFVKRFLDQDFDEVRHVVDTNITGTIYLLRKVGREMRDRGQGRILINGSIAGFMPGTYQAVYNGTKAFIGSYSSRPSPAARATIGERKLTYLLKGRSSRPSPASSWLP